ncbi:MAG: tRNA preQ1(34) S-adenosylmethionine ribosyltransferase-isomerase QueA [Candidatus Saccharimonadales bacterium]|nr:tRNA preQ1(34) S-adenosylmethionine ribosyltransferase-isomerase QueA [Candidatus Saccharimonadales bacterium]
MKYTIDDFDYHLPKRLIAHKPASPRDQAKLLVYHRSDGTIQDDRFFNLAKYLPADATLIVNNSKVEKARLNFEGLEVFLLDTINDKTAVALVRPGRKFRLGDEVKLSEKISAAVIDISWEGHRTLEFNIPLDDSAFERHRLTPFPPYIKQDETLSDEYQTVYADPLGSKAAPTAGLHFTPSLLSELKAKHDYGEVTLHVGLGTFAPVRDSDVAKKKLHQENYYVNSKSAKIINQATHITAVGTTTARVLESCGLPVTPGDYQTDIFIQPGYKFTVVDSLITNFHLPKSSLLMMIAAFAGFEQTKTIYHHAITNEYRFYSFGDAMLIL